MNKNRMGFVSVIIPVHNVEDYIERCLESICGQTYSQLQIIVVDDQSMDGSLKICEKFAKNDPRVFLIRNKTCLGVSEARNKGLSIARGEYIAFVDADDYIDLRFIEKMVNAIKDADISICGYEKILLEKNKRILLNEKIDSLDQIFFHVLCSNKIGGYCFNKLYKHEILDDLKFDKSLAIGEDIVFVTEYLEKARSFSYLNEPLYFYRYNKRSATRESRYSRNFDKKKVSYIDACDRLKRIFQSDSITLKRYISYRVVRGNIWVLLQLIYAHAYEIDYMRRIKSNINCNYKFYKSVRCGSQAEHIAVYIAKRSPQIAYILGKIVECLFPDIFLKIVSD